MTTPDQQPATYPWRAAPSHLRTRRQLRAAGLSPGGQDVAALMVRQRRGRRLVAHLFDIAKARPKRTPSPAQLEAIEKATRTHQLRAAERRGYTAADLHTPTELGPTWTNTTILEEETTVHTTESAHRPQGHGQSRAWLHALVATNQARHRRDRLDTDLEQAARAGEDAEAEFMAGLRADLDAAEERLAGIRGIGDPYNDTVVLADALYWSAGSPIATDLAEQITGRLATEWGVRVDPETWAVTVDPGFDATAAQTDVEVRAVRAREAAIVEAVAVLPLPDHTAAAVNWAVQAWADTATPGAADLGARREQLLTDLAGVQCSEGDRALVEFTVDYLTGHTSEVDLLDTPVLVDPGHEVRGRAQELLAQFAAGRLAPADIAAEIAVMTETDQQAMRDAGRAIVTDSVARQVWPEWADRDQITDQVHRYADDTQDHHADITGLASRDLTDTDRDRLGVGDDLAARIQHLAAARADLLDTAATAKGLTAAERHHLTAVVEDIDAGIIDGDEVFPELMWVDERTKAAVDEHRGHAHGQRLCAQSRQEVTHLLAGAGIDLAHPDHDALRSTVAAIEHTLHHVAGGSPKGVDADRKQFLDNRNRLGRALQHATVDAEAMTGIREVIDRHAHAAGQAGRSAVERRDRWHERIDQVVTARDDATAQRRAATAGQPGGPGRACTTGAAVTAHASGPGHSPRIRHLHGEEIGR